MNDRSDAAAAGDEPEVPRGAELCVATELAVAQAESQGVAAVVVFAELHGQGALEPREKEAGEVSVLERTVDVDLDVIGVRVVVVGLQRKRVEVSRRIRLVEQLIENQPEAEHGRRNLRVEGRDGRENVGGEADRCGDELLGELGLRGRATDVEAVQGLANGGRVVGEHPCAHRQVANDVLLSEQRVDGRDLDEVALKPSANEARGRGGESSVEGRALEKLGAGEHRLEERAEVLVLEIFGSEKHAADLRGYFWRKSA